MSLKTIAKILVPVLLIAVIGGMWFIKNKPEEPAMEFNTAEGGSIELSNNPEDADFSLNVTDAVDFESLADYGFLLLWITVRIPAFPVKRWLLF